MSGEAPTPEQLSPDVAARPIILAMSLAFAAALTVMTLLTLAFWYNLGSFPTSMSESATQAFPAPRLQVVPSLDLVVVVLATGGDAGRLAGDLGALFAEA